MKVSIELVEVCVEEIGKSIGLEASCP